MKRLLILVGAGVLLFGMLPGCNIFNFAKPESSANDLVAKGMDELRDRNYSEAEATFTKALDQNPKSADAHWGRAKARMRATGFTAISLASEVSNLNAHPAVGDSIPLPFMNPDTWPSLRTNTLYQAVRGVTQDLAPIYTGEAYSAQLDSADVSLDYSVALMLGGVLAIRDTRAPYGEITDADINLLAAFTSGAQLQLQQWNSLTPAEKASVKTMVIHQLDQSSVILTDLLAQAGVEGINADSLQSIIQEISLDLGNYHGNVAEKGEVQ